MPPPVLAGCARKKPSAGLRKPASTTWRHQENAIRTRPVCRRDKTPRPGRPILSPVRTAAQGAQRLRPGSARLSAPPPPHPPPPAPRAAAAAAAPLGTPRSAAPRGGRRGGEGPRSPPPRWPARLPSPEPTHLLLLLLLLVSPSWPPARPSRRRADAVPLPRGRRGCRRPSRPAAAPVSRRVRRWPRPSARPRNRGSASLCRPDSAGAWSVSQRPLPPHESLRPGSWARLLAPAHCPPASLCSPPPCVPFPISSAPCPPLQLFRTLSPTY